MQKNVAAQKIQVFAFDTTSGAAKTGDAANITAYVSKDYGAVTVLGDTSATEIDSTNAKGWYLFDLTQGETNADALLFTAKSTTANISIVGQVVYTQPPNFTTLAIDTGGRVNSLAVDSGTAQAGGAATITLQASASAIDSTYSGAVVTIYSGTGVGQSRTIVGYVGATKVATVGRNWATNPDSTSVYKVHGLAVPRVDDNLAVIVQAGTGTGQLDFTSGVVKANATQWLGGTIPAVNVTGVPLVDLKYTLGTISPATAGSVRADAVTGAVGSVTGLTASNLDAAISSRMASYTQPTGFLAATFPGSVASPTNITAGVITTVTNVTNAPTSGDFTAPMKTSLNAATPASVVGAIGSVAAGGIAAASFAAGAINAAAIADGAIDRATYAADTGQQSIRSNTAQAGSATTITLDAGASASNNFYNNDIVYITGGTGVGQARFITAYVGATKVATVATWVTNPDSSSTFAILPFDAVAGASAPTAAQVATAVWQDTTGSDFTTASSIGKSLFTSGAVPGAAGGLFISGSNAATTANITGNITGNLSGSVGSVTGAVGSVTGAVASVTGNVGGNVVGTVASVTGNLGGNVVGSVASVTAGVTLAASAVQAIWNALTSALTTAGSIGKLLVDNVDAAISSRMASAGYTAPLDAAATRSAVGLAAANLDTQLSGIQSDTDNIQTRIPAALVGGRIDSSVGAINADATAAANLAKTTRATVRATVTSGATTTSIPTSAFAPAGAAADQFKGMIVKFDADTTTTSLRSQSTDITASTNSGTPTLTVTALTTAPASGDTFSIQ